MPGLTGDDPPGMHFDKKHGFYLPGPDAGKGSLDGSGSAESKGHDEGRRSPGSARRKLIPGTIGGAIGAAVVAGLCAVSQHIPALQRDPACMAGILP